jgi:hypothetical protein
MIFLEVWTLTLRNEREVAYSRRRQEHGRHLEDAIARTTRLEHAGPVLMRRVRHAITARPRHLRGRAPALARGEDRDQDQHAGRTAPEHALGAQRS